MNKMDTANFQERARQDRKKLVVGVAAMTTLTVALVAIGTSIGSMAISLGVIAPIAIALFSCAGFLNLRLAKKMERDSYEEGMYLVMEGAPMNCTITDEKGAVLFCNDHAANMFNATKSEYARELFGAFLPEIQPDGTRSMETAGMHIQTAFKNGRDSFEWWHQMGPGKEQFPCTVNLAAASVYGMSRILVFLTDQRKAQEKRRQENEAKERMRAVLDASPLLCIVTDEDGNFVDVNKEAENMFGIQDKKLLLTNFERFVPRLQPDGADSMQKSTAMIQEAIRTWEETRYEYMYQHSDGSPLPTEEIITPINVGGQKL